MSWSEGYKEGDRVRATVEGIVDDEGDLSITAPEGERPSATYIWNDTHVVSHEKIEPPTAKDLPKGTVFRDRSNYVWVIDAYGSPYLVQDCDGNPSFAMEWDWKSVLEPVEVLDLRKASE